MPIHLVKLCVGIESFEDLQARIQKYMKPKDTGREQSYTTHTTRMVPKKSEELIATGSLYWVIKGVISARQKIIDIRTFQDSEGINRCNLCLEAVLVATQNYPRRPFQGWRYLTDEDAPKDLSGDILRSHIDPKMRAELQELRLI